MKQRLAVPGGYGFFCSVPDGITVGKAPMVVDVINQRNAGMLAHGKQLRRGIYPVIIFKGQPGFDFFWKRIDHASQSIKGGGFIPISATAMNVDHIGGHPLGHFGMVGQLFFGSSHHTSVRRGKYQKLIRMKRRPDVVFTAKRAALYETIDDPLALRLLPQIVTDLGMGFNRQNLAVDAKGPDSIGCAEFKGTVECVGVVAANGCQMAGPLGR